MCCKFLQLLAVPAFPCSRIKQAATVRMSYADNTERSSKATAAGWATAESVLLKGIVTLLRRFLCHISLLSSAKLLSTQRENLSNSWR